MKSQRSLQHSAPDAQITVPSREQVVADVTHLRTAAELPGPYGPPGIGFIYQFMFDAKARQSLHHFQV